MSIFATILETLDEERARLAEAPVGSKSHGLAALPVTISDWPEGKIIKLPRVPFVDGTMPTKTLIVVPIDFQDVPRAPRNADEKIRRITGSWGCILVYSDDDRYAVGGHKLVISAAELARGQVVNLVLAP